MIRAFTKEQRKQIHTIMNVDDDIHDEDQVLDVALKFVAQMCNPDVLESNAMFYITTDNDGRIILEMEV